MLVYTPFSHERVSSMGFFTPEELVKPINQRISNEKSEFNDSPYIDRQIERFMERSALKGVSLAIVQDEQLVFTRAYGFANEEQNIEASPEHLFRLASVSKLITAVAIMKLVEEGRLSLDDKVFGPEGIFNDDQYLNIKDANLKKIKILHLLNHTSGWTQRYGDPAFHPLDIARKVGHEPPATIDSYLQFVIKRRLMYPPGTMYSYSNIAYMFLGAIIERVSGMPYEDYVKFQLLFPNGIYDMHLAHNTEQAHFPNEVRYYEQEGSLKIPACDGSKALLAKSNGGNDVRLLGAAGAWLASAPELARFITLIDGFDKVPDMLKKESIAQMTGALGKPIGWGESVSGYWYRTGSFAGTTAMIHRRNDGLIWIFLSNTSNWQGPGFYDDINRTMRRILKKVDSWPEQDLFNYFDPEAISYVPFNINQLPVN